MEKIMGTLYVDEQDEVPAGYCEICGGALYRPSLICIRCRRDGQ
jgi:uncharacterized OB-fold protein